MVLENTKLRKAQRPNPTDSAGPIERHLCRSRGESEYRLLAEGVPDLIAFLDSDLRYCFVNRNYAHWFGYTIDKLIGKRPKDFLSRESYAKAKPFMDAALSGEPQYYEIKALTVDSVSRWLSVRYIPHKDDRGHTDGFYAVIQDIEERKRNLEALDIGERDFRAVVDNVSDAVFVLQDRIIQSPNPKTIQLTGYTAEELRDIPFDSLVHGEDSQSLEMYLTALEQGGEPTPATVKIATKSGELRWIRIKSVPIPWKGESASLNFASDVTELKNLEKQLRRAERMEAIGILAGGFGHDFNNILMIIRTSLEAMTRSNDGDRPKELENIMAACNRAQEMIGQILMLSRKVYQDKVPISVETIAEKAAQFLKASLPATIKIRTKFQHGAGRILGDPTQIHQVVMNLCTNAVGAMRSEGGILSVEVADVDFDGKTVSPHKRSEPGTHVMITVTDTGHGIEARDLDKLFDPFFTTKPVGEGTGLGLSVAHGIVKEHGGEILVESEVGWGSTFTVLLPRHCDVAKARRKHTRPPLQTSSGTEHILFVDDDATIAGLMKNSLERFGYRVTTAGCGKAALELFAANPSGFDMVVTDQTMPAMTGVQLAEEIVKIRPELPIVLCTGGFDEAVSDEKARASGTRALVRKPVSIRTLNQTLRGILDE